MTQYGKAVPMVRDPQFHARVRDLHEQGKGRNEIAKALSASMCTITQVARLMGLKFEIPPETRQAQEKRRQQLSERRLDLVEQLLEDSAALRETAWEPGKVFAFGGKDNIYREVEIDNLPARDRRDLIYASCLAATTAAKLLSDDLASAGRGEESRSILRKLGEKLIEASGYDGEVANNPYALTGDAEQSDPETTPDARDDSQ